MNIKNVKYAIYSNKAGRPNSNPTVAFLMRALQPGEFMYVSPSEQRDVHSFKRSMTKSFSTKVCNRNLLKVTCTASY